MTLRQQIVAVEEECIRRKTKYPRLVASGRMQQGEATEATCVMEAVLETLLLVEKQRNETKLFFQNEPESI